MAEAKYHVHVPAVDPSGYPLHPELPNAAQQWLNGVQPRLFKSTWVEGPHQHRYGPAHHVVAIAEDSPESDSYVKQLATHVGELSGHPAVDVHKHSKDGIQVWTVPNHGRNVGYDP